MSLLEQYAGATWSPPFAQQIPSNLDSYHQQVTSWQAAKRRAGRELNLWLHGQRTLVRDQIGHACRLLWIYKGTPQVGDSLMDLAARVLLKGRIERIDLLIDEHLVPLYNSDQVFDRVACRTTNLRPATEYDLVLLHSASSRSIRDKVRDFRSLPFVHVHGFYTGPEFNRTLFGFHRLAQLLGVSLDDAWLTEYGRPVMWHSAADQTAVDALNVPHGAVALALGGVRDWRTYGRWAEVLRLAHQAGWQHPWVLVGAENGAVMRDQLFSEFGSRFQFIDAVGRLTLPQTHALLQRCTLALCADGGLLHLAHAADVPAVALFAGVIDPSFRVTAANRTISLHGSERVDDIEPQQVFAALQAQAACFAVGDTSS
ncbi:MAG: glycosyltransferase family 9 protein [Leptothrix sp. (in: b-proteobacteria)]